MPTRILEIDILSPLPEIHPFRADEALLVILKAGPAPVGKLFAPPARASLVALDLPRHLPGAVSPARLRQAQDTLSVPATLPRQMSFGQICETFRAERELRRLPSENILASIVICYRESREYLIRCLESTLHQTHENVELILVDNSAPGDTIFDLAGQFSCRYIKQIRPGLSRCRNAALGEAKGEIVAFTEDDTELDPSWVQALLTEFTDPTVGAVTGPVLPRELETRGQEWFEELGWNGPPWLQRMVFEPRHLTIGLSPGVASNMAFRRTLLSRIEGFDPLLGPGTPAGGGEDTDALLRVLQAGAKVVFTPEAIVRKRHPADFEEAQNRAIQIASSRTALLAAMLHRERTRLRPALCHLLKQLCGQTVSPPAEDLGLPRSSLPVVMQMLASLYGPLAYVQSLWAARASDAWEEDDAT
ncbi:MAG: glycosyltransferase [Candidatus Riflebacteria bacterium]|nr:glycosyltransferase [Candidatus Riflebacteria bacterium]